MSKQLRPMIRESIVKTKLNERRVSKFDILEQSI